MRTSTAMSSGRLLEQITAQTGWQIFVEPGTTRNASAKFKNLPPGEALQMLLGDLEFRPRAADQRRAAALRFHHHGWKTPRSGCALPKSGTAKHVPNELLVKLKPGADIDALAKMYRRENHRPHGQARHLSSGICRCRRDRCRARASCKTTPTWPTWITITISIRRRRRRPLRIRVPAAGNLTLNPPGDSGQRHRRLD